MFFIMRTLFIITNHQTTYQHIKSSTINIKRLTLLRLLSESGIKEKVTARLLTSLREGASGDSQVVHTIVYKCAAYQNTVRIVSIEIDLFGTFNC